MDLNKLDILSEIKGFLEGSNSEYKYIVNVETDPNTNYAECVIHEPNQPSRIEKIKYEPFMYMKDLKSLKIPFYVGKSQLLIDSFKIKHGIKITALKTGNQKRLVNGYCYKITSSKSFNDIMTFLKTGGIDPYQKLYDEGGRPVRDKNGKFIYPNREHFFNVKTNEQFFISTRTRLFKGIEEYKGIHKLTFDIETTGLRYQMARIFAIGVRDNRGFETILEVDKPNDDQSEIKLIQDFFNLISIIKPAIISGYNSEMFDFEFILGRAAELKIELTKLPTTLKTGVHLNRRPNVSVKLGNTTEKFTATEMWGYSVIDIIHAAKKTVAINSDLKESKLKYIAKYENIAKPNRTYIKGEDNTIGRYYNDNKVFVINDINEYCEIPDEFQIPAKRLYTLQANKLKLGDDYLQLRNTCFSENPLFVDWLKLEAIPNKMNRFIGGKILVKQYLLDDLWETEQVDEKYNQSSFMLAKIIPTTYQRVCTMGTASIWNLLMTTWSYENDIAIPNSEAKEGFSGGLARCYKGGYSKRIVKIDYASLYPMIQLTHNVFPMFDITGVLKKMLLYMTTTRNIYKKLANGDEINKEEISLLKEIDHEVYLKYINNEITSEDKALFKVKQLPIKILNNSLFGALGSGVSFNWSDNVCAARITCTGRLRLRQAISWFSKYKCVALLAVTDGINFHIPDTTTISISDNGEIDLGVEGLIEDMWKYGNKTGISALIDKFNDEEMPKPFMSIDNDGESVSCLNLSRINYAQMILTKDKKTGEIKEKIKLTGNTIKSKTMPEYIEEFIDKGLNMILHGNGDEFIDYYYDYVDNIRYMQIPLKKIANKSKIKISLKGYLNRGVDKNGKEKGKQAHMELLITKRKEIAEELYEKHKHNFPEIKIDKELTIEDKMRIISNYMPPEPELDSVVYYYNIGYKKSHGDSKIVKDKITGRDRYCSTLINNDDLQENPRMIGEYNYEKYLDAFNKRVKTLLMGFDPEIVKKILVKIDKKGDLIKGMFTKEQLQLKNFDLDDYNDSMNLELMEVVFWNKTGYDPRKVWNGFKTYDDENYKIYYEVYENALNYLNNLMIQSNKPLIKSINDNYHDGDLVLIKDNRDYHVALYNGIYMQIVRSNIEVPKSEIDIEFDRKLEEAERKRKDLEIASLVDEESNKKMKERLKLFEQFKIDNNIPEEVTIEFAYNEIEYFSFAFEDYVTKNKKNDFEYDEEYLDDGGDGES